MSRTLIIGLGNPHRGDDGVGWRVVEALAERLDAGHSEGADVACTCALQLAPELLDEAAQFDRLVFVDAHVHPGWDDLVCTRVEPRYGAAAFTHHVTPAMFLALLAALHGRALQGWIVSIRGHELDFREGLSAAAGRHLPEAMEAILRLVQVGNGIGQPAGLPEAPV